MAAFREDDALRMLPLTWVCPVGAPLELHMGWQIIGRGGGGARDLNLDLVALGRRGLCDLDELATAARPETGSREVLLSCCLGSGGCG